MMIFIAISAERLKLEWEIGAECAYVSIVSATRFASLELGGDDVQLCWHLPDCFITTLALEQDSDRVNTLTLK